MEVVIDEVDLSDKEIIFPKPFGFPFAELMLKFKRFRGMGDGFRVEVGILHIIFR